MSVRQIVVYHPILSRADDDLHACNLWIIVAVPTRTHMKYQVTKALPYFFKRYVFMNKDVTLEPLYKFDAPVAEDLKKVVDEKQ